jgi:fatty acid desaturase
MSDNLETKLMKLKKKETYRSTIYVFIFLLLLLLEPIVILYSPLITSIIWLVTIFAVLFYLSKSEQTLMILKKNK